MTQREELRLVRQACARIDVKEGRAPHEHNINQRRKKNEGERRKRIVDATRFQRWWRRNKLKWRKRNRERMREVVRLQIKTPSAPVIESVRQSPLLCPA